MELNRVELALKGIYDGWQFGNEKENNGYSAMFRMGFPNEYIDSDRPLLMYVGQEDLDGKPHKTQAWVRKYQIVQRTQTYNKEIDRGSNKSPFWELYRKLDDMGYNCLWDNLDKFLKADHKEHLGKEEAVAFNAPYGEDGISVLQREINLLKPKVIVFAIGPREKYRASLASAFSIDVSLLYPYRPTRQNCVNDISSLLGLKDTIVLWTYHPNYLSRGKLKDDAIIKIETALKYKGQYNGEE
jgi:hypothetical protein